MLKLVGDSVPSVEEFMRRYNMDHPAALHRVQVGVPATIEHSSDQSGSAETAKWVAETTQSFITFMDALNLRLRAKDQLHPRLQELMTGYAKFKDSARWEGRGKIVSWLITLNAMKASDEITEDQARQKMLSAILRPSTRGLIAVPRGVAFAQRRTVISLSKTAATASGAGRNGKTELDDGSISVNLATPKEMGGSGDGQNPEQLFALGYSSCFLGALQLVAKNKNVKLSDDVKIKAAVSIGEASGGFGIGVEITAIGADAALVQEAHTVCPYSRILAEGAEVKLTIK
ncbi:Vacuolar protein-sorting-associated protein 28 [Ceratobasidium sp. 370]|nr:Vacuolar protein-sorting-associated protein 28 [Ceratobasidium sp. 370]